MTIVENSLAKYRKFFNKTGSMILEAKGWHASKYMDFTQRQHDCVRNGCYCLNYHNSTYNLLREHERRTFFLQEAVGEVQPYSSLLQVFKRFCKEKLNAELMCLSEKDFGFSDSAIPLVEDVYTEYKDENIDYEVFTLVSFQFAYYSDVSKVGLKELLSNFVDRAEDMNYGLAKFGRVQSVGKKQPLVGKDLDVFFITFEAKYNNFQFEFADWLYHFTSVDALHSINKEGLTPHSTNPEYTYDNRVYLFNKADYNSIVQHAMDRARTERWHKFAFLRIKSNDLTSWNSYKDGTVKFYVDTKVVNDLAKDARALFTYEAIPRDLIDDTISVFEVDDRFRPAGIHTESLNNY